MNKASMQHAIEVFQQGGIVIFPTDTAYGIGCRIDAAESVKKVFQIRNRPEEKAVLALVSSIKMAEQYLEDIPTNVKNELMKKYWPGGLTIILRCDKTKVPSLVRGGGDSLGVRLPNHKEIIEIIDQIGVPIIAPSANFAGEKTPFSLQEVDPNLIKLVDYVLEGDCTLKQPSTVINCTQANWQVIRSGAVKIIL